MMSIFWLKQYSQFLTIEQLSCILCLSTAHAVRKGAHAMILKRKGQLEDQGFDH